MIRRCECCAALLGCRAATCSQCGGAELSRVPVCGEGAIVSCTVVTDPSGVTGPLCAIAIVELDEGPWIYAWIEGITDGPVGRSRVRLLRDDRCADYPHFVCCAA